MTPLKGLILSGGRGTVAVDGLEVRPDSLGLEIGQSWSLTAAP